MIVITGSTLMKLFRRKKEKTYSVYYNRIFLLNTLLLVLFLLFSAILISNNNNRIERIRKLQNSRDVLNTIYNYYDSKHQNLVEILYPLYMDSENLYTLTEFVNNSDLDSIINPLQKQRYYNLFEEIFIRDSDIKGLYLYSSASDITMFADAQKQIISTITNNYDYYEKFKNLSGGRQTLQSAFILNDYYDNADERQRAYAIAGSLRITGNRDSYINFAVLYDGLPLEKIIDRFYQTLIGRYLIINSEGEMIFDSYGTYESMGGLMDEILLEKETINHNGNTYYAQFIKKKSGKYTAVHIASQDEIGHSAFSGYIFIVFGILAVASILMHVTSALTVSAKVKLVLDGMENIGSNNLSYRIPVDTKSNNEFSAISQKLNEMGAQLEDTIHREYITEIKKKNAELAALQSWINPHFLYNTLEMIRLKSLEDGNQEVSEMIVLLAKLFRNIAKSDKYITIFEETNTCSMYLDLLSHRYNYKFSYDMSISPETLQYCIPKNILQPIIENYFVHGMKKNEEENELNIEARLENNDVVITFSDNGLGIQESEYLKLKQKLNDYNSYEETKFGLLNIQKRLKLIYGDSHGIDIESQYGKGTNITLRIRALLCSDTDNIQEATQ